MTPKGTSKGGGGGGGGGKAKAKTAADPNAHIKEAAAADAQRFRGRWASFSPQNALPQTYSRKRTPAKRTPVNTLP
jgi:hypothetical protein